MNTEDLIKQLDDKKLLDLLYGYAYKRCDNSHDADDLCSDIILELIKSFRKGIVIDNFNAFFWTVARRTHADFCQKRKRQRDQIALGENSMANLPWNIDPYNDLIESEADALLLRKIKREIAFLTKIYRDVLIMYYLDEMKISDIAQALGISETTVKQRLFSARNVIKKEVDRMDQNNITLKPMRISFAGTGNPVGNNPSSKAERILSQNIIYLCKDTARSSKELSELLNIPMVYMEEELEIQCRGVNGEYGLLRKLNNGKYISNFLLLDADAFIKIKSEYKKQIPAIVDQLSSYVEANKDRFINFPFLTKQKDIKLILWIIIHRIIGSYQGKMSNELRELYFPDIKLPDRQYSLYGIASKSGEVHDSGFYGSDGNNAHNVLHYKSVFYANIYGDRIEKHFSCGHNITNDPLLLMTLKSIEGIPINSLLEDEKETAAKAIEQGYLRKQDEILYPKILILDADNEKDFYRLAYDFLEEVTDLVKEATKISYELIKTYVPEHLMDEYSMLVLQYNEIGSDIIEECIARGILTAPDNNVCAEGTWMVVEK